MGTRTKNIKAIACMSAIGGIGKDNTLLGKVPGDLENFSKLTRGKAIFMGPKTASSLPNKKPLKDRTNYVACRQQQAIYYAQLGFKPIVAPTFAQALAIANVYNEYGEMWVIGGGVAYRDLIRYCSELYLTIAPDLPLEADTWFPVRYLHEGWSTKSIEYLKHGATVMRLVNSDDTLHDLMADSLRGQ